MNKYKHGFNLFILYIIIYIILSINSKSIIVPFSVQLITLIGWIVPYMITRKCPLAIGTLCIKKISFRPWMLAYQKKWFLIILLTLPGLSTLIWLTIQL